MRGRILIIAGVVMVFSVGLLISLSFSESGTTDQWHGLPPEYKIGYVTGWADAAIFFGQETPSRQKISLDLSQKFRSCIYNKKLSANTLVSAIESYIHNDIQESNEAMLLVTVAALSRLCKS